MTKLLENADAAQAIDYVDVAGPRAARAKLTLRAAVAALVVLSLGVAGWFTYTGVVVPRRDESRLQAAIAAIAPLKELQDQREDLERLRTAPSERRYFYGFVLLSRERKGVDDAVRVKGARAALDLAARLGSADAYVLLGKALRDGVFGSPDPVGALRAFQRALELTDVGVQVGDPDALYVRAQMLWDGLGLEPDRTRASAMALRAGVKLTSWRLRHAAIGAVDGDPPFAHDRDPKVVAEILRHSMKSEPGMYSFGLSLCDELHPSPGHEDAQRMIQQSKDLNRCHAEWLGLAARAGYVDVMGRYGSTLLKLDDIKGAAEWFEKVKGRLDAREAFNFGLIKMVRGESLGVRREGLSMTLAALDRVTVEAMQGRQDSLPSTGSSMLFMASLASLQEVELSSSDQFRLAVAARAIGVATSSVGAARFALQRFDPYVPAGKVFDSRSVVAAAEELVDGPSQSPRQGTTTPASTPPTTARSGEPPAESAAPTATPDREQQDRTGYVRGAPQLASGGLSNFTVDNSGTGVDAIARLYLDGRKPAVRTLFVKRGEKFTATKIAPGSYVLRYRHMGSEDTYEADRTFVLKETQTEDGTRYGNVTVTLYGVKDGNMKAKRVPSDLF